ncbi:exonuclease domain-containing protein [Aliarcobacter butzleri]|uniref:exonuclease domain-containing protein n=1 Tax=Aliarcobacter butzleri TaxID=28197 RepID=UPI00126131CB|nr:exonuclease domain-containing protein [Aliarcobacter butzleri]MDK2050933.1 exonuclease domain-containing protein [Aliarcobacter butzleri]
MNFIAIDVETANADYSSICQIGLAFFNNGVLVDTWNTLVNPKTTFDYLNVSIHGIKEKDVVNAPTISDIYNELNNLLKNQLLVSHMPFDRVAITQALLKNNLENIPCNWLDTAKVVRRTWKELSMKGYGLSNVASKLNIEFKHHDALEDAKTCGLILIKALDELSMNLEQIQDRVKKPINEIVINYEVNPNGNLYGENIVFTGALNMTRKEAFALASQIGCNVQNTVNKDTSLVVVGDYNILSLAGYEKSSKHRKAEELILKGQQIKIITEDDFNHLIFYNT